MTELIIAVRTLAFVAALLFCVRYAFYKWWKTPEGIILMGFPAILALFMLLTAYRLQVGPFPAYYILSATLSFIVLLAVCVLHYVLGRKIKKVDDEQH